MGERIREGEIPNSTGFSSCSAGFAATLFAGRLGSCFAGVC